jgi:aldehyde dehydrogenase (NAD+)
VFTKNIDQALRIAKALEAGSVGVNCTSPVLAFDMPLGGWKGSGIGHERIEHSLKFLGIKSVYIKIADGGKDIIGWRDISEYLHEISY